MPMLTFLLVVAVCATRSWAGRSNNLLVNSIIDVDTILTNISYVADGNNASSNPSHAASPAALNATLCSLGYRATKQDSELLIVGSIHGVEFVSLAWRTALNVEIDKLDPSKLKVMFESEGIGNIHSVVNNLKALTEESEKILAMAAKEDADASEVDALKAKWLSKVDAMKTAHQEAQLPMVRELADLPSNASGFSECSNIVEQKYARAAHVLRGFDVTLFDNMLKRVGKANVDYFETEAHTAELNKACHSRIAQLREQERDKFLDLAAVLPDMFQAFHEANLDVLCPSLSQIRKVIGEAMTLNEREKEFVKKLASTNPAQALIVVGVGHLVRDSSNELDMLSQLQKLGYTVEPVSFPPVPMTQDSATDVLNWNYASNVLGGLGLHSASTDLDNLFSVA